MATHEVLNQPPPLEDYDVADDPALLTALRREGAGWAEDEVRVLGRLAGSRDYLEHGRLANENPPRLRTHDGYGHRIDEVEFHPSWHALMAAAVGNGLHATPWIFPERRGAHVARAAKLYVWGATDAGHLCPVSMTYAVVPALRHAPDLARQYEPLLAATSYDFGLREPSAKTGLLAGMSMTEKQGGSDVRANTTRAVPAPDGSYRLTGHKWFTSAPMNDLFLVLAQAPGGLSCFLLPRVLPDGTRNAMHLQRLKDKLGNRSNASAEVEYDGAVAWLVGEEGRGVRTIIEMVNMTRLDCVIAAATAMRSAVVAAAHHARYRSAFGGLLIDAPLMRNVLADLALEWEATTAVAFRLAGATDRGVGGDAGESLFRRLALAVTKYWTCKQVAPHAAEALECLGGNGYIEESGMPRLYREAPLVSIWEGSGNVAALDALRAVAREPETLEAFFAEVSQASGADQTLDKAVQALRDDLGAGFEEGDARRIAGRLAIVLQASLLVRYAPEAVANAFCVSRLGGDRGGAYGTLPAGTDFTAIMGRVVKLVVIRKRRPVGVAFLQERVAALDRLIRHVREPRRLPGEQLLADEPVVDEIERVLQHALRGRALAVDANRPLQGNLLERSVRHDAIDHPHPVGVLGIVLRAEEEDLTRELLPHLASQVRRSETAVEAPDVRVGLLETGVLAARQGQVADDVEAVPPAGRPAGNHADHDLRHEPDQPLSFQDVQPS
jgi:putative acyl-CoA dehydrogenase